MINTNWTSNVTGEMINILIKAGVCFAARLFFGVCLLFLEFCYATPKYRSVL
jgi:hypothetical protein